jgi:hypothetical protein
MRRRDLLRAAGLGLGTAVATAGCVSRGVAAGPRRLELDRVETPTDAVRLNDAGPVPRGRAPTVDSLSDPEREAAEAALDGGYETDAADPPDWLVAFVAETPFLRRDGSYYRLVDDLPRYTITAEETTEEAVDGPIADEEAYERAVTHDGVRETPLLTHAREDGVTRLRLWPSFREFLDSYDAVRYRGSLLTVSVTVDDDGPPYELTAERVGPTELTDEPVYDATDASEEVREAVRAAGETGGVYAGDLPEALLDAVETHQYVYLEGTFYWAGLENRGELPVAVEAEVVRADMSGDEEPRLRLALHNEGDRELSVFSGAPAPFGVLRVRAADEDREAESLLWTDAYRENTHVGTEGRSVTLVEDIGLTTPLAPGERLERTFTVVDSLPTGEYVVRSDVGVETVGDTEGGGGGGTLPYRVYLRVVEA